MPKVVRFHETGPADVLKIQDLPLQKPRANEARIKVEAIGLNRAEVMFRRGKYLEEPRMPQDWDTKPLESWTQLAPGREGTQGRRPDDAVPSFSLNEYGTYGESVVTCGCARYVSKRRTKTS